MGNNEVKTKPEEQIKDKTGDGATSTKTAKEATDGLDQKTQSYKDYVKERKGGQRDAHTKNHLGDQPVITDEKAEQRKKDVETAADLFEKAKKKEDLTDVIAEITKKHQELTEGKGVQGKAEYKEYIKELNEELHKRKLLPKGENIDDTTKVDTPENLAALFSKPVLPVTGRDGNTNALDAKGNPVLNSYNDTDNPFKSKRENKKEHSLHDEDKNLATLKSHYDLVDRYNPKTGTFDPKGDGRVTKDEIDDYIDYLNKNKPKDYETVVKSLEYARDNFGAIKRTSNDDHQGIFGKEQGISKEDIYDYSDEVRKKLGDKPAERPADAAQRIEQTTAVAVKDAAQSQDLQRISESISDAKNTSSINFDEYLKKTDQQMHDAGLLPPRVHLDADAYKKGDVNGLAVVSMDDKGKVENTARYDSKGKDTTGTKGIPDLFSGNDGKGDAIDQHKSKGGMQGPFDASVTIKKGEDLSDIAAANIQRQWGKEYKPSADEIKREEARIAKYNNIPEADAQKKFDKDREILVPQSDRTNPNPPKPVPSSNPSKPKPTASADQASKKHKTDGIIDPFET